MGYLNFNKEEVKELVMANRHNHITTTYYLLLKKHIKMGRTSVADLSSDEYIRYINDPKNLKDNNINIKKSMDKTRNSLGKIFNKIMFIYFHNLYYKWKLKLI